MRRRDSNLRVLKYFSAFGEKRFLKKEVGTLGSGAGRSYFYLHLTIFFVYLYYFVLQKYTGRPVPQTLHRTYKGTLSGCPHLGTPIAITVGPKSPQVVVPDSLSASNIPQANLLPRRPRRPSGKPAARCWVGAQDRVIFYDISPPSLPPVEPSVEIKCELPSFFSTSTQHHYSQPPPQL